MRERYVIGIDPAQPGKDCTVACIRLRDGTVEAIGAIGIEEEKFDCEEGVRYWLTIGGKRIGEPGNFTSVNVVRDWLETIGAGPDRGKKGAMEGQEGVKKASRRPEPCIRCGWTPLSNVIDNVVIWPNECGNCGEPLGMP